MTTHASQGEPGQTDAHEHDHEPGHVHGPGCSHGHGLQVPFVRDVPKVGRNEPCPCGSGKKFKKCHAGSHG